MNNNYTFIDEDIYQCNDCGAYADKPENIKHHITCIPGDCERWAKIDNIEEEEEL